MIKSLLIAGLLAAAGAVAAPAMAEGPGTCGRGKIWDADARKCVPKPRSSGSGSHNL
ncbi:MAG: hypothetical protein ACT4N2_00960 [Hyphomicrobium sp.]